MPNITLPNGKKLKFDKSTNGVEIAKQISLSLYNEALVMSVNGKLKDLNHEIKNDCEVKILTSKVSKNRYDNWLVSFEKKMKIEINEVIKNDTEPVKKGLTMGEVIVSINEYTKGDAVIVTDVGQHQMVACRYAKFVKSKSNITSGGLGTMGFALPAAIGAKMGAPERQVVAIIGDGGYQMTIQELGTIFQTGVAVKIVVLNNDYLGKNSYSFGFGSSGKKIFNKLFEKINMLPNCQRSRLSHKEFNKLLKTISCIANESAGFKSGFCELIISMLFAPDKNFSKAARPWDKKNPIFIPVQIENLPPVPMSKSKMLFALIPKSIADCLDDVTANVFLRYLFSVITS